MRIGSIITLISLWLNLSTALFAGNIANKYYLQKQRFLLEILHHVQEPLLHDQWLALGQQLVSDQTEYVLYNTQMRDYYAAVNAGRLLPRDSYYNPHQADHYRETLGLYYFFYNTREWSTLRQNICWARRLVNPGLFLHALTQALLKREDYRALVLPKIYELLPEAYHDERLVRRARLFDYGNWNRQQLLHGSNSTDVQESWPKALLPSELPGLRNSSAWSKAMAEVHVLWLPEQRQLDSLGQLTLDPDWQAYWYYVNMGVELTEQQEGTALQLREWWYFQLSQLLARYKLERYGQRLEYRQLRYEEQTRPSQLRSWQGERYQDENIEQLRRLMNQLESAVEAALATGCHVLANGTRLNLRRGSNWQLGLSALFPYELSRLQSNEAHVHPQLLLELNTSLRSPNFYHYAERLLRLYRAYRSKYQPNYRVYTAPYDVRIEAVEVDPLTTYYESVDTDLSQLLAWRHFYYDGVFMWQHTLQARRQRLQHRPFALRLQLATNETQSVIIRTYLTTAVGSIAKEPHFQLDAFLATLNTGINRITRESRDFYDTVGDHISWTELYQYVRLAEKGSYDFPLNISTPSCGFPRHLLLPKGGLGDPLRLRLLVIATPYTYHSRQANELSCDFSYGLSNLDELPLGYPFERDVEEAQLRNGHIFWQPLEIYHEDHSDLSCDQQL